MTQEQEIEELKRQNRQMLIALVDCYSLIGCDRCPKGGLCDSCHKKREMIDTAIFHWTRELPPLVQN